MKRKILLLNLIILILIFSFLLIGCPINSNSSSNGDDKNEDNSEEDETYIPVMQMITVPEITNFEMGWNAVFLIENIGLKLQIKNYSSQVFNYDKRIDLLKQAIEQKQNQVDALDSLKNIYHSNADYYQGEYEKTQDFFYDRIIVYGGYGLGNNGMSFQIGIGIKLWGLKPSKLF